LLILKDLREINLGTLEAQARIRLFFREFGLICLLWRDLEAFCGLLSKFFEPNAGFENVTDRSRSSFTKGV
jgi:hypothetical protein